MVRTYTFEVAITPADNPMVEEMLALANGMVPGGARELFRRAIADILEPSILTESVVVTSTQD